MKKYLLLHFLLLIYSFTGVLSKYASKTKFLSFFFITLYGGIILILGVYAIIWQQLIKKIPITTAFANKSITIVWGLIWSLIFFNEYITLGKLIGIFLIVIGIILFSLSDKQKGENSNG